MTARAWVFTINNPINNAVPEAFNAKYCVWQLEKGENDTPHLQGYCQFENSCRLASLKKLCATAHWEKRRGTHDEAVAYCTKDDTRVEGPWSYGVPSTQGKRTDLDIVTDVIKAGGTLEEVARLHSSAFVKFFRGLTALKCTLTPPRNHVTESIVYFGPTGTGKSHRAFSLYPDAYWLPQGKWFDNYNGQSTVVIDEFYGWLSYSFLLRLLDKYPLLVESKGGHVQFVAKLIVFTSNTPPWEWYGPKCKLDPLKRRLNAVYEVTDRDREPTLITTWPEPSVILRNWDAQHPDSDPGLRLNRSFPIVGSFRSGSNGRT